MEYINQSKLPAPEVSMLPARSRLSAPNVQTQPLEMKPLWRHARSMPERPTQEGWKMRLWDNMYGNTKQQQEQQQQLPSTTNSGREKLSLKQEALKQLAEGVSLKEVHKHVENLLGSVSSVSTADSLVSIQNARSSYQTFLKMAARDQEIEESLQTEPVVSRRVRSGVAIANMLKSRRAELRVLVMKALGKKKLLNPKKLMAKSRVNPSKQNSTGSQAKKHEISKKNNSFNKHRVIIDETDDEERRKPRTASPTFSRHRPSLRANIFHLNQVVCR